MNSITTFIVGFVVGFAATGVFLSAVPYGSTPYNKGYMQGQIDAVTGKMKYELKELPSKERVWVKIEKKE